MLEGVVKDDHVDRRVDAQQFVDAVDAILAYGHHYISVELVVDLKRLVADVAGSRPRGREDKAFCASLVSTAQHGDVVAVAH